MEHPLQDQHIGITSGPTRVWLDPVRYIANASTGELGAKIADRLALCGASIDFVSGVGGRVPQTEGIHVHTIETPAQVLEQLESLAEKHTDHPFSLWILCMAVLDFAPAEEESEKIPSGDDPVQVPLAPTPKIIDRMKKLFPGALLVGFKLETTESADSLRSAAEELADRSGCDLVVANPSPFLAPSSHTAYFWETHTRSWTGPFEGKDAISRNLVDWIERVLIGPTDQAPPP